MVEAAAVICVVGIVLAVFIPTFVRELRTSKTSEAAQHLELLYQRSAAYFAATHEPEADDEEGDEADDRAERSDEGEGDDASPDAEPAEEGPRTRCLPPTAGPTPRMPTRDPERVDFTDEDTPGHDTWRALGFQPPIPVRYSYTFEPTASGCGLRSPEGTYLLTLRAEGDLDGDGERSVFERRVRATEEGALEPFGILYVRDRAE